MHADAIRWEYLHEQFLQHDRSRLRKQLHENIAAQSPPSLTLHFVWEQKIKTITLENKLIKL